MRLVAAVSGGVDSAVALARAVDAGHQVTAVHLALAGGGGGGPRHGCCTPDDARDARRAADVVGVPFYVWDLAAEFHDAVVEDFVAAYAAGDTPNPCVRCNERIKFAAVLDRALDLGFDGVVTGHHAQLRDGVLRRSVDPAKDQSYVLGTLTAAQRQHTVLPLGADLKTAVRTEAAARGLLVADKPDSHDVCFVPGRLTDFLTARLGPQPGPVLDAVTGAELGTHAGAYAFTVGQRRGLALDRAAADGAARYVVATDPSRRAVLVGPASLLRVTAVRTGPVTWGHPQPVALPGRVGVQWRAHGTVAAARVQPDPGGGPGAVTVTFDAAVSAVATGQTVVFYGAGPADDDVVLGGAVITAVERAAAPTAAGAPAAASSAAAAAAPAGR